MPRQRFASKEEIEDVLRAGGGIREIMAKWGVSHQTAYNAIHFYRLDEVAGLEDRTSARDEFGWTLRPEHVQDHQIRMLRYAWRAHQGREIVDPARLREANSWLRHMRENDYVLTYHPSRGFGWSPRKPTDEWMWRHGHWGYPAVRPSRKPYASRRVDGSEEE